ncbi:MAG TPA: response regulator [Kofleriaceae bacterium]|nr:response regulator [Kofleriaceae bacterium]
MASAIAIAPRGATGPLQALVDRLTGAGITVAVVDDIGSAAELVRETPDAPPCVLLDLRDLAAGSDVEDVRAATGAILRVAEAIPRIAPVAVTGAADAALIVACIRAGAGDVIDLQLEGTAHARAVVERACARQAARVADAREAYQLRVMIEELFRDLIRTERRSLDLEGKLLAVERASSGEIALPAETRGPAILLVESDRVVADELAERLEQAGVTTYSYPSGEQALREVDEAIGAQMFDLALVAAQLPGLPGLATVRELRLRRSDLPAFLVTAVHDAELAAGAADLGVVGFVVKPLPDVSEVVARLAQLAQDAWSRERERFYLQRIKARHERVLARYRSLPREP